MPFQLRDAGPEDAGAIADIHLRARAAAGDAFPPSAHADEEFLPHLLRDVLPTAEVRLAIVDGNPVGYTALRGDLLEDLYVAPEAQGTGAGTVLLDDAKARRPGGLRLWVFVSNRPARRFYEHRGFIVAGGTDGDNDEGAPDLLLLWRSAAA